MPIESGLKMEKHAADSLTAEEVPAPEVAAATGSYAMHLTASMLLSVLVVMLALTVYHYWLAPRAKPLATVDLAEVLELKQLEVTAASTKAGATDKDRAAAFDEIGRFARDMEAAVSDLSRDCDCVLLVRAAVVRGVAEDLTPALKKKMGVDRLNAADMMQAIASKPAASALAQPLPQVAGSTVPVAPTQGGRR